MRISDWSSDVCSPELPLHAGEAAQVGGQRLGIALRALAAQVEGVEAALGQPAVEGPGVDAPGDHGVGDRLLVRGGLRGDEAERTAERTNGVEGKGVYVRVGIGARRTCKKKKHN